MKESVDKVVAQEVSMKFGDVLAIENVSCAFKDREFVAIIGPSGCGKSTFLYALAGFVRLSGGEILVDGKPVTGPGPDRGIVFQEFALYPWRTVLRNITLGLEVQKVPRVDADRRAQKWIRLAGLSGFEHAYPATLSGGMKQRVAIARTLTYEPGIVLLDEPFGALDVQTKNYMIRDLQDLWMQANKTIVMVTHSVSEALLLADRVLIFGARPSTIIGDVAIELPHPRNVRDTAFKDYEESITATLSVEVDRSMSFERQRA